MKMKISFTKSYLVLVIVFFFAGNCILFKICFFGPEEYSQDPSQVQVTDTSHTNPIVFGALISKTESPIWVWNCIDQKCVKSKVPALGFVYHVNQTLEVCQITCGRFGAMWPRPTGNTLLNKLVMLVNPDRVYFEFEETIPKVIGELTKLRTQMTQLFIEDMKTLCTGNCCRSSTKMRVKMEIESPQTTITWGTNESYYLLLNTTGSNINVVIKSVTIFGARHGLQSLFQLMTALIVDNVGYLYVIKDASIFDNPVYPHRGLLIDTSRNYLNVNIIKRTIDGMGHSKMNVLHWHATDSHSFPLVLPRVPELAKYGAYSSQETYTLQDIAEIVNYGKARGVRVIMEIDSPGHAGNGWQWGEDAGLGALAVCINRSPWESYCLQPPCGQLNPVNPNTYKVLENLYTDLIGVFPKGEVFHMGGDEVRFACWKETLEIVEYMKRNNMQIDNEGFTQLWAQFHIKSAQMLDSITGNASTPIILWSSDLTKPDNVQKYLNNKKFIIQTWADSSNSLIADLLEKSYTLILSSFDAWYLDHTDTWEVFYNNLIPEPKEGVLGGEACMWGERVDNVAIEARIWPRAAAVAERLWSNPENRATDVVARFLVHRERLVKMGIKAASVAPKWCIQNEGLC